MDSVKLNNTLQEDWTAQADSGQQWSHCAVAPLYIAYHGLLGLRPLVPGFRRVEWRPQLGDLEQIDITAHTVQGAFHFSARGRLGDREVVLELPPRCQGEILLPAGETVPLEPAAGPAPAEHRRYSLSSSGTTKLSLKTV